MATVSDKPRMAMEVSGHVGKQKHVNGTYEMMQSLHNEKPCWVARTATPMYLFHTGKSRWVISKNTDDGARCYVYVKDDPPGQDPTSCKGPWQACNEDNEWVEDKGLTVKSAQPSTDPFVKLRLSLEGEMNKYGLLQTTNLKQLWKRIDCNGNNIVSLAEIDKLAVDMCEAGTWPKFLNSKPALMRAYKKTITVDSVKDDDWVQKGEFHALLLNMFWFGKLWEIFDEIDTNDDRKVTLEEFKASLNNPKVGLNLTHEEAVTEFKKADANGGGEMLFVEFCAWVRGKVNPDHNTNFDADIVSGEKSGSTLRRRHGAKVTHSHFVAKKCLKDFDDLEEKVKSTLADEAQIKKLWQCIDFNGNGNVSLAELDKFVITKYPLLNHKPALMRAFQATIKGSGDKDDYVQKHEFKPLLGNVFYFNKLYWLFDQVDQDHDRRLNYAEFKWCLKNCGWTGSEAKTQAEFKKVDKNGGGIVLFDEFCLYWTQKACPECMQAWTQ
jgi:Ca2+-binding EF-hand superfamily protein